MSRAPVKRTAKPKQQSKASFSAKIQGSSRTVLLNPKASRTAAKAATTRMLNRGWIGAPGKPPVYSPSESNALKEGVLGMAVRHDVSSEQQAKLEAMDPEKLSELYRGNRFVFEQYFDYGGISQQGEGGPYVISENRRARGDVDFLIEQYERVFGTL